MRIVINELFIVLYKFNKKFKFIITKPAYHHKIIGIEVTLQITEISKTVFFWNSIEHNLIYVPSYTKMCIN